MKTLLPGVYILIIQKLINNVLKNKRQEESTAEVKKEESL